MCVYVHITLWGDSVSPKSGVNNNMLLCTLFVHPSSGAWSSRIRRSLGALWRVTGWAQVRRNKTSNATVSTKWIPWQIPAVNIHIHASVCVNVRKDNTCNIYYLILFCWSGLSTDILSLVTGVKRARADVTMYVMIYSISKLSVHNIPCNTYVIYNH